MTDFNACLPYVDRSAILLQDSVATFGCYIMLCFLIEEISSDQEIVEVAANVKSVGLTTDMWTKLLAISSQSFW